MNHKTNNGNAAFQGVAALNDAARQSLEAMSKACTGWMRNANRAQAETIRFINDRFNKDLQTLSRFGCCTKPEDFINLQSELAGQLVTDYMEEGAKLATLFGEMAEGSIGAAASARK